MAAALGLVLGAGALLLRPLPGAPVTAALRVVLGDQLSDSLSALADLDAAHAIIEGTVNDTQTRERVAGAVVTAVAHGDTEQTITDDQGRYRFPALRPGTYAVSAYYSISGRGQIEVRRGDITVAGAEAVIVPLWIEMMQ